MRVRLVLAVLGLMVTVVACGDSGEDLATEDVTRTTEADETSDSDTEDEAETETPVEACELFGDEDVEALLGRPVTTKDESSITRGESRCMWDAGFVERPGGGGYRVYLELQVAPGTTLPEITSGDHCTEEDITDLGDEAVLITCSLGNGDPSSFDYLAVSDGTFVSLSVNPEQQLSDDQVRAEVERILAAI